MHFRSSIAALLLASTFCRADDDDNEADVFSQEEEVGNDDAALDLSQGKKPIELTDETFEHHTQAATGATTGPWMVMFYAPWCGACRQFGPDFEKLSETNSGEGKPTYARVDCDGDGAGTCRRFRIKSYPTVKFFMSGKMAKHHGVRAVPLLKQWIDIQMEEIAEEGEPVPAPLSWWTEVEFFWEIFQEVFWELYRDYPWLIMAPLYISVASIVFSIAIIAIFGFPKKQQQQAAAPAPPTAEEAAKKKDE